MRGKSLELLHIQGSYSTKYSFRWNLVLPMNKGLWTPDFRNLAMKNRQATNPPSPPVRLKGGAVLVGKAEVYLLTHILNSDLCTTENSHLSQKLKAYATELINLRTKLMIQEVPYLLNKHQKYLPENKYLFNFFQEAFIPVIEFNFLASQDATRIPHFHYVPNMAKNLQDG